MVTIFNLLGIPAALLGCAFLAIGSSPIYFVASGAMFTCAAVFWVGAALLRELRGRSAIAQAMGKAIEANGQTVTSREQAVRVIARAAASQP